MNTSITVRDIDLSDKSWLQREAHQIGVSMEEMVRRLIHEKRTKTERRLKPAEAFAQHFRRSMASSFRLRPVVTTNRCHSPPGRINDRPPRVAD